MSDKLTLIKKDQAENREEGQEKTVSQKSKGKDSVFQNGVIKRQGCSELKKDEDPKISIVFNHTKVTGGLCQSWWLPA